MALEAAGMTPAWQVEVEPQAASVLRYRWPAVDLHADVRNVGVSNLARVDLICGGFPCQDLSVAGKRAGLAGERSGLFYEFMRVVDELAPRWVLIENVPGLLSSNGGRDMGTVLGTLGRLGYGWTYRCLDTQYFGPPQRRLRVFIVGRAGGFCPPEVLLEPEGLPWNPAPRREAREGSAGGVEGGAGAAGSLTARYGKGTDSDATDATVVGTLEARTEAGGFPGTDGACAGHVVAHTLRSEGADASEDGTGRGTPLVCQTLTVGGRDKGAGDSYDNTPRARSGVVAQRDRVGDGGGHAIPLRPDGLLRKPRRRLAPRTSRTDHTPHGGEVNERADYTPARIGEDMSDETGWGVLRIIDAEKGQVAWMKEKRAVWMGSEEDAKANAARYNTEHHPHRHIVRRFADMIGMEIR